MTTPTTRQHLLDYLRQHYGTVSDDIVDRFADWLDEHGPGCARTRVLIADLRNWPRRNTSNDD